MARVPTSSSPGSGAKTRSAANRSAKPRKAAAPPVASPAGTKSAEPRAKSRIGEANVEKILDAALGVFARFGLRGARTDQIAEAAGMSKPNLLYYFRSKEALYTAVLERTLAMWLDPLARIDPDMDPRAALTDYIERKLAYSRSHPDCSKLFATEIIQGAPMLRPVLERDLVPLVEAKTGTLKRWIAEGKLAPVDPVTLVFMMWATTQHYADFAAQVSLLTGKTLDDPVFHETTRATILKVILDGVLPR